MSHNPPWQRRQEIPDPQVLDAADQYEAASRLLWERSREEGILLPFLNTSMTAVELYLKALSSRSVHVPQDDGVSVVYADPDVWEHAPSLLMDALPRDVRLALEERYRQQHDDSSLRERCAQYDQLFKASRYPFDQELDVSGISIDPLRELIRFLKEFVHTHPSEIRISW